MSELNAAGLIAATEALAAFCDDTSPNKRMASIAIRAYLSTLSREGAGPVAWRWKDGDMRWQATADEDRASYAFRVDGYEVHDLYAAPASAKAPLHQDRAHDPRTFQHPQPPERRDCERT